MSTEATSTSGQELRTRLASFDEGDLVPVVVGHADPVRLEVPKAAVEALLDAVTHLSAGHAVTVVPDDLDLTTEQAAELLNVSEPHLLDLLDSGEIDSHGSVNHRHVRLGSLLSYRAEDDYRRRLIADEIAAMTNTLDLT
ncbi:MAG TPA: helix-turn-helix domain-containing protein [Jiangellaceae bacterium]|nr:helix-turn-helix domain-containing protein [Jiangellaceae bacterium]